MSTSVIEPGTRLAGRFRLDDRVSEAGGSTFWKATDEILARPVAVLTFAPGFPRVHDVVTAARAASRLTDPRLTQVFDADDSGENAYVVSEWVTGETLEDLLAEGPMEPGRAAAFLMEAAEALASAHSSGLAHLCITPHNLVWTSGGTVKVTGLGVEAVLAGAASDTPAAEDTQGLGELLYASLTGHWCGAEGTQLPSAPSGADGRPVPPSQVRPGVPPDLDDIVCRALHIPARAGQEPLSAPSEFVSALGRVPRSPLPFVPLAGSTPPGVINRPDQPRSTSTTTSPVDPLSRTVPDAPQARTRTVNQPQRSARPQRQAPVRHSSSGGGGSISRPVLAAIVVGVLILVALGGWGLSKLGGGGDDGGTNPKAGTKTSQAAKPTTEKLSVAKVLADNDAPHVDSAANGDLGKATDDNKSSYWTTQHYNGADFGRLRSGIGLVLDMGKTVTVSNVKVMMPPGTPGNVELHIGDSPSSSTQQTDTGNAVGSFTLNGKQAKGRYVTLWFTKLPNIGEFKARVRDVAVYGTG
ncbi:protein kinase family protein [Actinoallomurus iriomotensis]|uniref:non-specific serine/threonine protein kinase n=1 Tax=Actinoallomurus iriomotensis TaxID=478107 RepID=A0A9W6S681_9ACTN|nr:AMP-binding protein [Actinoallomurus iriomotensis]GLY87888.1 serine/threonine protein kinase [Actinoallomurus iriomotensis]